MNLEQKLITFLERNNGCITTKQLEGIGIRRSEIPRYINKKIIVRNARGIYISPISNDDDFYNYQVKHKNTIFSYNSSLYLLGFLPLTKTMDVTTYRGNNPVPNPNVKIHWVSKNKLNLGIVLIKTKAGNIVKCYSLEKTICDIIKNNDTYTTNERNSILQTYFNNPNTNLTALFRYADLMKITNKVKIIMEIIKEKE